VSGTIGRTVSVSRWCSYPECEAAHYALDYCYRHYKRVKMHGDPSVLLIRRGTTRSYLDGDIGYIELTRGKWAMVDAADFPDVNRFIWQAHKGRELGTPTPTASG